MGVTSVEIGLKMLAAQRIHYLLDNNLVLGQAMQQLNYTTPLYRFNVGEIFSLFPYINKRHAGLFPQLEELVHTELQLLPGKTLIYDPSIARRLGTSITDQH